MISDLRLFTKHFTTSRVSYTKSTYSCGKPGHVSQSTGSVKLTDQQLIRKRVMKLENFLGLVGLFTDQCWLKDTLVHVEQICCPPECLRQTNTVNYYS